MINTIIIDKPISDIYLTVQSQEYIKYVFDNPIIESIDDNDNMKILVKYNKNKTLSKYENDDFINLVKSLFSIDDVILSIEQSIVSKKNQEFTIRQVLYVESYHNDIFFATMFGQLKILIEISVSEYKEMAKLSFNVAEIVENNNFGSSQKNQIQISDINNYKLKKISIKKYLQNYEENKKNFFQSDVKYSDNIIMNILNTLVNNAIISEYMRNICEYYTSTNVNIYSLSES